MPPLSGREADGGVPDFRIRQDPATEQLGPHRPTHPAVSRHEEGRSK
jgi:hypothetical protein